MRSAVALELAAGKVWALPIAVQSARGTRRRNGTGHPEWVRCHGPRAGAASHHACRREELLRCWADSETRPQGSCSTPRAACDLEPGSPPCARRRGGTAGWTQSPGTTPADSLTPQDRRCSPYPHSTGPGPTRRGVGPYGPDAGQ